MPIYDYTCSACGRVTEVIHGINADGPRFCPSCGAEGTMRKALTAPAIVFKGSGWAKLDRRSSSGGGSSRGATKPAPGTSASSGQPAGSGGETSSTAGSKKDTGGSTGTASSSEGGA